jgi:cytochrome c-type biogenesis protein CcsB
VFPKPNDDNNTWYDPAASIMGFEPSDGSKIRAMMGGFFESIDTGKADEALKFAEDMSQYQKSVGAKVYPSEGRVGAEIFYNKTEVFKNLIFVYLIIGFALLAIEIAKIAKPDKDFKTATLVLWGLLGAGFVVHTANLGLRWYISGHAPWSNGFESMTYIAWATILAGFIFSKKSPISFALTGILAGVLLFVAHLSWMDPQITNIVPVLKSYWLTIHVSMITASYGFLALGALIGFVCLILFIFRREDRLHIDRTIKELAIINEMTLIVGLMMLTIGNFLGGVWANESWGRYWGWDPKETWALISILIYAIVVHYRFIPGLKSLYAFSVLSTVAISSVVMTYFGVNFYLSGLHSYASGDPVPVPMFVWVFVAIVAVTIFFASKNKELER